LAKPAGERVSNVKVAAEDGSYAPIDPEATYTLATNAYMADGGDNYAVFKQAKDDGRQTDLFVVDYDAFTGYLATLETASPSVEGRITRVFVDAGTDHPAYDAVQALATKDVFPELSAGGDAFTPKDALKRIDTAVWLARGLGLKLPEAASAFSDVAADHGFAKELLAAKEAGIFLGLPGGAFHPDAALTKGQAALVLERAFGEAPAIEGDANAAITRGEFAILLHEAMSK
jgi:hypothetical protein